MLLKNFIALCAPRTKLRVTTHDRVFSITAGASVRTLYQTRAMNKHIQTIKAGDGVVEVKLYDTEK